MVFKKINPIPNSDSLECEVRGLRLIKKFFGAHGLKTPEILSLSREQLVLERIEAVEPSEAQFRELGEKLARLHIVPAQEFGFETDNFIGLNPQINGFYSNWGGFFLKNRLEFQVSLVKNKDLKTAWKALLNECGSATVKFLNRHAPRPSLLHGDLWSGNVLFAANGVYLVDPAVYYGDREVDIAMTQMFGGFSPVFYESYNKTTPLPEGYRERVPIYNLYHYLNHYNIFGESYLDGVNAAMNILRKL